MLFNLTEAEFFRPRWSERTLSETRRVVERVLVEERSDDPGGRPEKAVSRMREAFEEAQVENWETLEAGPRGLRDVGDVHVIAAAARAGASTIAADNLGTSLDPVGIGARGCDASIADIVDPEPQEAAAILRTMRQRFERSEVDAGAF